MTKTRIVLGTMNFGIQNRLEESKKIIDVFLEEGYDEIDTAHVYNNGDSENFLGAIMASNKRMIKIGTKVSPKVFGNLKRDSILKQFTVSLERLRVDCIDILYIHFPDRETLLEEIYSTCNELFQRGKIKELGLSNHSSEMVKEICELCISNNWILPTVYQGLYNALSRNVEKELFGVLRKYGIRFYAYNPLAGGMLSGKYLDFNEKPVEGRFVVRPNYLNRYWKESFFDSIKVLYEFLAKQNITLSEASLMWLSHHSYLDCKYGDGIILGVSNIKHLKSNIDSIIYDKLNEEIIHLFEVVGLNVIHDSPNYYRYFDEGI